MVINELQRTAEESLAAIHALERSRSTTPHIAAASAGILGSGFLAGSVFAITAGMWLLAIPLGAIGLFGWLVGYIAHGRVKRTTAARTAPEIARHYETLYGACEQADRLVV
jgi:hypothetical protein